MSTKPALLLSRLSGKRRTASIFKSSVKNDKSYSLNKKIAYPHDLTDFLQDTSIYDIKFQLNNEFDQLVLLDDTCHIQEFSTKAAECEYHFGSDFKWYDKLPACQLSPMTESIVFVKFLYNQISEFSKNCCIYARNKTTSIV